MKKSLLLLLSSVLILSANAAPRAGYLTRVVGDGTTISGTGRTGDPLVAIAGGALPSAHTHTTTAQGGDDLLPDTIAITSSAKLPTVTPTVSTQIGFTNSVLSWHDGSALRKGLYDLTAGHGILVTGSGGTRVTTLNPAVIEWTTATVPMGETSATATWPTTASTVVYAVMLCPTAPITTTFATSAKRTTSADLSIGAVTGATQTFDVLKFQ